MKKKILMLGNSHLVIFGFRGELIQEFIKNNYEVIVAFPNGPFGEGEKTSQEYGCEFIEIPMNRRGKNPFQEIILLLQYIKMIKKCKPDIVLAYTVKCDIYGGIACRILKTPFVPNITGIGKGLAEGGITKTITTMLYRIAARNARCIFFQNEHDKKFFQENKIFSDNNVILPGSGVNLEKYKELPYPDDSKVVFTYIARVMKAKGIEEFLIAANEIKRDNVEFHICGYCEENYKDVIKKAEEDGIVIYHGLVNDIVEIEKITHCIVLPSFHPEGISNVLLEGAACGRPLITTYHDGCRETVDDGVTGFLVMKKDSKDLIEKIKMFLQMTNEERRKMGHLGRIKMENQFSREIVIREYLKLL